MIKNIKHFAKRAGIDLVRCLVIVGMVFGMGLADGLFDIPEKYSYLTALLSSTSIVLLVAAISHVTRRILFPGIDLKVFAKESMGHPIASALVFLSVCVVISVLILSNVMLLS